MANDITTSISSEPIKNGTAVLACSRTGFTELNNLYVQNKPTIVDLADKYDNRFYNGIFVSFVGDQTLIGG